MIERPPIITERDLAAVMLDKSKRITNIGIPSSIRTARKVVHPHKNCGFV